MYGQHKEGKNLAEVVKAFDVRFFVENYVLLFLFIKAVGEIDFRAENTHNKGCGDIFAFKHITLKLYCSAKPLFCFYKGNACINKHCEYSHNPHTAKHEKINLQRICTVIGCTRKGPSSSLVLPV